MKDDASYFATLPSDAIGAALEERVQEWDQFNQESGRLELIKKLRASVNGCSTNSTGSLSWKITSGGEQGEMLYSQEQHIANISENLLNLTTAQRPSIQCGAANTDKKSLAQTLLADGLIDYHLTERKLEATLKRAARSAIELTEGFISWDWDVHAGDAVAPSSDEPDAVALKAGQPRFSYHGPLDVIRDTSAGDFESLPWLIVREYLSKYEMAARYPELADRIVGLGSKTDSKHQGASMGRGRESDLVPVCRFFHDKTPAVPEGRLVIFLAGDVVPFDGPLAFKRKPVAPIVCKWMEGSPFGISPLVHLLGPQDAVNALDSTIVTNQLGRGIGNMVTDDASDVSVEQIGTSMNLIKVAKGARLDPLEFPATPSEYFQYKKDKIAAMETLSGVNSVLRGSPNENVGQDASGAKLALIEAQAIRSNSGLESSWTGLIRDVALYGIIGLYRDFGGNVERLARIAGKNNQYLVKEFTSEDMRDIDRVKVDMGDPMLRTPGGKMTLADKAVELGVIKPGELQKYVLLWKTGTADPLFEKEMAVQMRIRGENERLMEGGTHRALLTDPHWIEVAEHLSVLDNPAMREDNPENEAIHTAVLAAVQEHLDLFAQMPPAIVMMRGGPEALAAWQQVQQALAPPMPPPGPGAPPVPPGESGAEAAMNPEASKEGLPGMPSLPTNPSTGQPNPPPGAAIQ